MFNSSDTTLVKVNFRCNEKDKPLLKNSDCLLHISVGQEYHEGEKFLATMDLVNETFKSCTIVLCDTLQRHTLKIKHPDMSDEEAYLKARALGNAWLQRNELAYKYLTIKNNVTRWDHWLNHKDYAKYLKEVITLYNNDDVYREKITSTINRFLQRQGLLHDKKAFELCKAYILEECPVLIPLWAQTKCHFVVYPRFRTLAMVETYKHFLGEDNPYLLREVALKFNHRVTPKSLSFSCVDAMGLYGQQVVGMK